jgi:hypothetical protein
MGQDLVDVFLKYYPPQFFTYKNFKKGENPKLERYGELNPAIISYYFDNLNYQFLEKKKDPKSKTANIYTL